MEKLSKHRTFLMGFAALWVYWFHVVPENSFGVPLIDTVWHLLHTLGFCGVDMFLFVSGFGLAHSLAKNPVNSVGDYGRFVKKRLARLLPAFVMIATLIGYVDGWTVKQYLGRVTGLRQFFVNVYDFLWYVPCVMLFYLVTPFILKILNKIRFKALFTFAFCAVWIAAEVYLRGYIRADLYAVITRVAVYMVGLYAGTCAVAGKKVHPLVYVLCAAALLFGLYVQYGLHHFDSFAFLWSVPAVNAQVNLLIGPSLCMLLSLAADAVLKLCAKTKATDVIIKIPYGIVRFVGTISLEVYITQEWLFAKMRTSETLVSLYGSSLMLQQLATAVFTLMLSVVISFLSKKIIKKSLKS